MVAKGTGGTAALVAPDGSRTPLTEDMYKAALEYVNSLLKLSATAASDAPDFIGTGEAASMLGVSRQTFNRMLEAGEIPFERYGASGHRRVRRSDVAAFRERSRSERALALADMRAAAFEGGLYGIDFAKEA
ncbi:MAG TPA: helix-turn-helix domain-containing protein [Rubneribacter badeniensis]|uniref:Helix-turn-helix domain-containing protein n=1 Tax=Rubneribacter badeniensis TaxID=2070688 RepID=A0A9D2VIU7_9ACTN|nr:helix-turn-helix domain-containing protein [Rubneribacter badeniensis]